MIKFGFCVVLLSIVLIVARPLGKKTPLKSPLQGEDPDTQRTFEQIVTSKGYPCERHLINISDGYILTFFRIPFGAKEAIKHKDKESFNDRFEENHRPPVFLLHGLLDSSFTWIINEPTQSLPYLLADQGYDVWMGNNRGNVYSNSHKKLKPSDPDFWNFSWDEMALFDFPEAIEYILSTTGFVQLSFVGHSQGTLQAFASLASNPSLSKKINLFVGYGPLISVAHIGNTLLYELAVTHIDTLLTLYGIHEFFELPKILNVIFAGFCDICSICCEDVVESICGPHYGAFNTSRMSVMAAHEPGGTSVRNIIHWAQLVRSQKFQKFDYGREENRKIYGQDTPPQYPFSSFPPSLPLLFFSGGEDALADPDDTLFLLSSLPNQSVVKMHDIPDYAHLDFTWATDANTKVYKPTIAALNSANFPAFNSK